MAFLTAAHRPFVAATIRALRSALRRRFFLAAFAGTGVAADATPAFRKAAQRFLDAAGMRRGAPERAMRWGASLSNPCGPVISTRTPPRKGSAAIQASCGLRPALSGGGHGRLDALPAGGGDSLSGGCGEGQGVRAPARQRQRPVKPNVPDGNAVLPVLDMNLAPWSALSAYSTRESRGCGFAISAETKPSPRHASPGLNGRFGDVACSSHSPQAVPGRQGHEVGAI